MLIKWSQYIFTKTNNHEYHKKKKIFSIKNNTNTFLKRYKHDKRINYDTNQGSKTRLLTCFIQHDYQWHGSYSTLSKICVLSWLKIGGTWRMLGI